MWEQLLAMLGGGGAASPGLASAMVPAAAGTGAGVAAETPGIAAAFAPAIPAMGSGQYGLEATHQAVNGMAATPSFTPAFPGGPLSNIPGQETGSVMPLNNDAMVHKLAMSSVDPAKLAALMGIGQQQQQKPLPGAPAPASGHGVQPMPGTQQAAVRRPAALGR